MARRLNRIPRHSSLHGYTLVEMMIVIAISAILLALAVPSFVPLIQENRLLTVSQALQSAFTHARSAAVRRGSRVSLCASPDSQADSPVCGMSTDVDGPGWGSGWIVFTDSGTLGVVDGTDVLLSREDGFSSSAASGGAIKADKAHFTFQPTGLMLGQAQTLTIAPPSNAADAASMTRYLCLAPTGRVRTSKAVC